MISAGLSGVVAANVPGNMRTDGSRGYGLVVDPKAIKAAFRSMLAASGPTPPLDEMCYLICQLAGLEIDIVAEQNRIDFAATQLAPTFEGVVSGLFNGASALRGNT